MNLYRGIFCDANGKEIVISIGFDASRVRARVRKAVYGANTNHLVGGWVERKEKGIWKIVDGLDSCFT